MTAKTTLLVATMGILSTLLFRQNPAQKSDIPAMIKKGALLIDTRSPGEFDTGHIKGAINIPHDVIDRQITKLIQNKEKPIIVYCHSGIRSSHARKVLLHMGYTHVTNGGSLHHMQKILEN